MKLSFCFQHGFPFFLAGLLQVIYSELPMPKYSHVTLTNRLWGLCHSDTLSLKEKCQPSTLAVGNSLLLESTAFQRETLYMDIRGKIGFPSTHYSN